MKIKETDLYEPLKIYLEHQGYKVSSEVKNCDLVARKDEEMIIVELKTGMSVALLIQAVYRKEITESVYVAIPVPVGKDYPPQIGGIKQVLRRLEVGLILVRFMKTKTKIEIALHPVPFTERMRHKRKQAILREIDGRYAEFNRAGSPTTTERISSYKQEAIRIVYFLTQLGTASPRELVQAGSGPRTQMILSGNIYGWFEKVERGVYTLSEPGRQSFEKYRELLKDLKVEG